MKNSRWALVSVMIISLAIFSTGCAKKAQPVAEETAPVVQVEPAPVPEPPVVEPEPVVPAGPSLEDLMAMFEETNIYFDFDKYSLTEDAREELLSKAAFLKDNPDMTIQIEGHCDERGTTEYNLALGERRAKAAQDYLVALGIDAQRVAIISYGKEKPLDPSSTEEAWAKNRRDHFVIVNK